MQKKELAFVLGSTGNMAFAVANVVMGIKNNYNKANYEVIIFCDKNFQEKDKVLLRNIAPCMFEEYQYFTENTEKFDWNVINRFTVLAFSRYECFKLLEKYKKVIWLDIDLLINKSINDLPNYCEAGIGLYGNYARVKQDFFNEIPGFDMERKAYNSGVVVMSDNLENPSEIANWCYEKTIEYANNLKCPDQGILNLALQRFNLKVCELPEKYNCHPDFQGSKDAIILHPFCMEKFWNFYSHKTWNTNYKKWKKLGGSRFTGKVYSPLGKLLTKFKKKYFLNAPDPFRHTRKFIKYIMESKKRGKNVGK